MTVVNAAVSFTQGFYHIYAGGSDFSNSIYLYELIVIIIFELWSLIVTYMAFSSADAIWQKTEARMAEAAASSVGLENALTWDVVYKQVVMMMVACIGVVVSGFSLTDVIGELVGYFDEYDDKTKTEGDKKDDPSDVNTDGTSAEQDIG